MKITKKSEFKESEEFYKTIFDSVNDMIVYVDKHGNIVDINKSVEEILGYKRDEIIGKSFAKLGVLKLKDIPKIVKLFAHSIIKGKEPVNIFELEVKDKNGNMIPIEASTRVIKKNGKVVGTVNILRDITERKKADEELRKSKKELEGKVYDLERFSKVGVGRELKMVELKNRIKELESLLKKHGIELEEDM